MIDAECVRFSYLNAQFREISLNVIFRVHMKTYIVLFCIDLGLVLTGFAQ